MNPFGTPRIGGVLETCLYAEDLAATGAFYEGVLGLEPFSTVEGRHVFFRCGPAMFLLFNPARTAETGDVPGHGSVGPGHVAFAIPSDETDAWRARFRSQGVELEKEMLWPGGGLSLYVRDPAGNSVELASPSIWSIPEGTFAEPLLP